MKGAYRRPGRFKLFYFAVLIFHGSTYSWSSNEGRRTANEAGNSEEEEDKQSDQAYQNKYNRQRERKHEILVSLSVSRDERQDGKTSGRPVFIVIRIDAVCAVHVWLKFRSNI